MSAERGIPAAGTFNHMLVRFDWNPNQGYREFGYSEVRVSRSVDWPKGMDLPPRNPNQTAYRPTSPEDSRAVCAIFVSLGALKTRLCKIGWQDVTGEYKIWLKEQEEMKKPKIVPTVQEGKIGEQVSATVLPRDKQRKEKAA